MHLVFPLRGREERPLLSFLTEPLSSERVPDWRLLAIALASLVVAISWLALEGLRLRRKTEAKRPLVKDALHVSLTSSVPRIMASSRASKNPGPEA